MAKSWLCMYDTAAFVGVGFLLHGDLRERICLFVSRIATLFTLYCYLHDFLHV